MAPKLNIGQHLWIYVPGAGRIIYEGVIASLGTVKDSPQMNCLRADGSVEPVLRSFARERVDASDAMHSAFDEVCHSFGQRLYTRKSEALDKLARDLRGFAGQTARDAEAAEQNALDVEARLREARASEKAAAAPQSKDGAVSGETKPAPSTWIKVTTTPDAAVLMRTLGYTFNKGAAAFEKSLVAESGYLQGVLRVTPALLWLPIQGKARGHILVSRPVVFTVELQGKVVQELYFDTLFKFAESQKEGARCAAENRGPQARNTFEVP